MTSNMRSGIADRLEGLAPGGLLALAEAAARGYADDGGDAAGLVEVARTLVKLAAGETLGGGVDDGELIDSVVAWHRLGNAVHAEKLRRIGEVEERQAYMGRARTSVNLWVSRLGVARVEASTLVASASVLRRMPETAAMHADGTLAPGHVADAARTVARLERLADAQTELPPGTANGADPGADEAQAQAEVEEAEDPSAERPADVAQALDALVAEQVDAPGRAGGAATGEGVGAGAGADRPAPARQQLRNKLEEFAQRQAPELLAERERRLWARRNLRLVVDERDPDQPARLLGELAPVTYAKAHAVIHALAGKREAGDARTFGQRCHDALDRVMDIALASGDLPDVAGDQPRVLVIVDAETLQDEPGAPPARLDGYGPVSPATSRQLCCDAEVTEVVLGERQDVLYVGRDRRKPNRAQRRATFARDGGCIGCGAPVVRCQIHHVRAWEDGGPTDIDNLVAVCWECHTGIHHFGWRVQRRADGRRTLYRPGEPYVVERLAS